ncbi:MAG: hypothetical protein WCK59_01305 [Candidatus Falkowbacteria bacterium]
MKKISIYIAGSVKKDAGDGNAIFASDDIKSELTKDIDNFEVVIFDPNESKIFGNGKSNRFGQDCLQVTSSNFLVIDLREKRGLGVGAEMMLAKEKGIPVISVCPTGSHYKRSMVFHSGVENPNWVHPFVESLSDAVVEDFGQAGQWIKAFIQNPIKIKSSSIVEESVKDYLDNFLDNDLDFKKKYLDSLVDKI